MFRVEVRHRGLNKYRLITGADWYVVNQKAVAQTAVWEEMWARRQATESARQARVFKAQAKEEKKALAAERTAEAKESISEVQALLVDGINRSTALDWEAMKDSSRFSVRMPVQPTRSEVGREPKPTDRTYKPNLGLLDHLLSFRKIRKLREATRRYNLDHDRWREEIEAADNSFRAEYVAYQSELARWQSQREDFVLRQQARNESVDSLRRDYLSKLPRAVQEYYELVLSRSPYPDDFPHQFQLEYKPETGILLIEYELPAPSQIPRTKEVRYVQSRDEFTEISLSPSEESRLYDSVVYQIALRTLHEVFTSDAVGAIESVVFNGRVHGLDATTGHHVQNCIMSLQASREEFARLNLAFVDPKACFKKLKGIAASTLHSLSPVAPVVAINRQDARFVEGYAVADSIEGFNLAAMDWEDFEHLIREIFAKEFDRDGGEVKVTRASRDGGVDAVAFDPDPIRGGKIVIQAKRYTHTVGVAAVRDLYGTVINEGASKGILVTTADYGPDAYEFAKDKPLTLLNGGNLLHLLSKHGRQARIELAEARRIQAISEKPFGSGAI